MAEGPEIPDSSNSNARNEEIWHTENMYQQMKKESNRLRSYYCHLHPWPRPDVSPRLLARAGLFYIQSGGKTLCAFCRGAHTRWHPGMDPTVQHAYHYPRCPFVRDEDVGNVPFGRDLFDQNESQETIEQDQDVVGRSGPTNERRGPIQAFNMQVVAERQPLEAVRIRQDPQFARLRQRVIPQPTDIRRPVVERESEPIVVDDTNPQEAISLSETTTTEQSRNEERNQTTMCKICLDRDIQVVFIPCGHLAACNDCFNRLNGCPICKRTITRTYPVYFT